MGPSGAVGRGRQEAPGTWQPETIAFQSLSKIAHFELPADSGEKYQDGLALSKAAGCA
jgi:hypothetical protein